MFEANHQCISRISVRRTNGVEELQEDTSAIARNRCDPYRVWFRIQNQCTREENSIDRIEWTFDHSINGGPFYRIVDERDACALTYKVLQHNEWIKVPETGAQVVGYPVENIYR